MLMPFNEIARNVVCFSISCDTTVSFNATIALNASVSCRDGDTEHERLLSPDHVTTKRLPLLERRERPRRESTVQALRHREELVAEAVLVEPMVRLVDEARCCDGATQDALPGRDW